MLIPASPAKKLFAFNERNGIMWMYSNGASQIKFGKSRLVNPIQKNEWKTVVDA